MKQFYNRDLLRLSPHLIEMIQRSVSPLRTALKFEICGNLIDFAAKHQFSFSLLEQELALISSRQLAANDSGRMFRRLETAKELLYLRNNCGEIVLDKLFIQVIRFLCPDLHITYAVRGSSSHQRCHTPRRTHGWTRNGRRRDFQRRQCTRDRLKNASIEFQKRFNAADVVISKGQGNYESLIHCEKQAFLFLAKCVLIADQLEIPVMEMGNLKNRITQRPS